MSIAAVSSAPLPAAPPSRASEEASESAVARAQEAAQAQPATKAAATPGTGQVVDVTA